MGISQDLHIHTVYSGHSSPDMIVGAIIDAAEKAGVLRICILEHVPDTRKYKRPIMDGEVSEVPRPQIDAIKDEIERWRGKTGLQLMLGAEIDADPNMRDGRLLCNQTSDLRIVMASTHFLPGIPAMFYEAPEYPLDKLAQIYEQWMVWTMHVAANPAVDVLAHPGREMQQIGAITSFGGKTKDDFAKLLMICKAHNTAFEMNESLVKYFSKKLLDEYCEIIALACEIGVKISFGSDAHSLDKVGKFPWISSVIKRLGIGPENYFQPRPLA